MEGKINKKLPDIIRVVIMKAPIKKVWEAVATSEGLASWLMPNDFEASMGYKFTFKSKPYGNWDGTIRCEIMELEPPYRVGFTWCGNNMELYVSFELQEVDEGTKFTLVHSGWAEEHIMIREKMYEGWDHLTEELSVKLGDENVRRLS